MDIIWRIVDWYKDLDYDNPGLAGLLIIIAGTVIFIILILLGQAFIRFTDRLDRKQKLKFHHTGKLLDEGYYYRESHWFNSGCLIVFFVFVISCVVYWIFF